jgi:hypothetical protein
MHIFAYLSFDPFHVYQQEEKKEEKRNKEHL